MKLESRAWWEAAGAVLASIVALPSLAYPLGRDQAVYFYVAREWLHRGSVVYKDVFEHKTPGIYVIYTAAMALLGEHVWIVRAVEIPLVLGGGWLAAACVDRTLGAYTPGLRGAAMLAASILHYGFLGFWDTGQCEIWCVAFVLASLVLARPDRAVLSGLCAGCALLVKPTSLPLTAVVAWRLWRVERRATSLGLFAAGAAAPTLAAALYLAHRGALGSAIDVLVHANLQYVANENVGGVSDAVTRILDVTRLYLPLSLVIVYGAIASWLRARKKGDDARADVYALALSLGAAGFLSVCLQLKFYVYHFEMMAAGGVLAAVALMRDAFSALAARAIPPAARQAIVAGHLLGLFAISWVGEHQWFRYARDAALMGVGVIDRERFARDFRVESAHFDEGASELVASWLRAHARPGDELCVRSFEPQVYVLTGMRCASRFFWTAWITDVRRVYRREEWLAEDRAALEQSRPRFVTVKAEANGGVDQEPYFSAMGYVRRATIGEFYVLELGGVP